MKVNRIIIVPWNDDEDDAQQYDLVFEGDEQDDDFPEDELALYRDDVLDAVEKVLKAIDAAKRKDDLNKPDV